MPRYRVKDRSEEFECRQCGEPLYVGDGAWQDGQDGDCYCSAMCCVRHGEAEHRKAHPKNSYHPAAGMPQFGVWSE